MYKIIVVILLLINFSTLAQVNLRWNAMASLNVNFGTQSNAIKIGAKAGAVTTAYGVASEMNAGVEVEAFTKKYGVKTKGSVFSWESYVILGADNDSSQQPFYTGDLSMNERNINQPLTAMVYGVGLGVNQTFIKGELKDLANRQGIFITRVKLSNRPLTVRIQNDFRAFLFFGSGTDQGRTGNGHITYAFFDHNRYLHEIGIHVALFTPVPDYSKNPTDLLNSDYESKPVLSTLAPFKSLFHGNFYFSHIMASAYFNQQFELGVDSQHWGAKVQNMIHDGFGLYARFPWEVNKKNQLYFQSQSSMTYGN